MSFASAFTAFLKYLPSVISGVAAVEQVLGSGPGNGATKKQLVLSAVTAAAMVGETVPESHVSAISSMIDAVVGILNKTNLLGFGSSAPASTAPAP